MKTADAYAAYARLLLPQAGDPPPGELLGAVGAGPALVGLAPDVLAEEHERAFGPSLSAHAPPYETCYGGSHVFMQSQQLADIAGFYRAFGLQAPTIERVDHLAVELEFMHAVTVKEAMAHEEGRPEQADVCREATRRFLSEHLGRWTSAFAGRMKEAGLSPFYAELAAAIAGFVADESRRLDAQPAVLSPTDVRLPEFETDDACGSCSLAAPQ